jgi:hypothetical protein
MNHKKYSKYFWEPAYDPVTFPGRIKERFNWNYTDMNTNECMIYNSAWENVFNDCPTHHCFRWDQIESIVEWEIELKRREILSNRIMEWIDKKKKTFENNASGSEPGGFNERLWENMAGCMDDLKLHLRNYRQRGHQ